MTKIIDEAVSTILPTPTVFFPSIRLRRLRQQAKLRDLLRETQLTVNDIVLPLFIKAGNNIKQPIVSMPGHHQLSLDYLEPELESILKLKIPAVILFGIPAHKDALGSEAWNDNGIIQQATHKIKNYTQELLVIGDLCFCGYTDHGHCGVVSTHSTGKMDVDNDKTLALLAKQAVSLAQAGVDIIAPSGMMDGMVQAIRSALDQAGFNHLPILSYSVKYASSFYGPFRQAAEGAPKFGDRSTYQMDPGNAVEALREVELDIQEGADMIMIKPAQSYLDIIYRVKQQFPAIPLGAYQVSGEYAMLIAAAEKGWLDKHRAMQESLLAIKRAGADFIITYFAKDLARILL